MGGLGVGIYQAPPAASRYFPVYFYNGEIINPEFAYPLRKEIISTYLDGVIATLVPIGVFLFMQIRIGSFWDFNNAVIGLVYSVLTGAVFQVILKWLIGGLRPHFLTVCDPWLLPWHRPNGEGFGSIMYQRDICMADKHKLKYAMQSFPSGHTTAAFAGFVFLFLYLNAKLKVWSDYHPAYWKLIVTYTPILGATLIGGALTIDKHHHWYDIIAGAVIGTIMAFSSYRMVYASVWDLRFNHIPLMRHLPFPYGIGASGFDGFRDAVWTRKADWGQRQDNVNGAPSDAGQTP